MTYWEIILVCKKSCCCLLDLTFWHELISGTHLTTVRTGSLDIFLHESHEQTLPYCHGDICGKGILFLKIRHHNRHRDEIRHNRQRRPWHRGQKEDGPRHSHGRHGIGQLCLPVANLLLVLMVFDHLHHDGVALMDQLVDAIPPGLALRSYDIGGMQKRRPLQPDVDEGGLHAGQHPADAAFENVAVQPSKPGALDDDLLHHAVLYDRDAGLGGVTLTRISSLTDFSLTMLDPAFHGPTADSRRAV